MLLHILNYSSLTIQVCVWSLANAICVY